MLLVQVQEEAAAPKGHPMLANTLSHPLVLLPVCHSVAGTGPSQSQSWGWLPPPHVRQASGQIIPKWD